VGLGWCGGRVSVCFDVCVLEGLRRGGCGGGGGVLEGLRGWLWC